MRPRRRGEKNSFIFCSSVFLSISVFLFPPFLFISILKYSTPTLTELYGVSFFTKGTWRWTWWTEKHHFYLSGFVTWKSWVFWPLSCFLSACSYSVCFVLSLFCGQGRICELIISGSIAGLSCAPSLSESIVEVQWHWVLRRRDKERLYPGDPYARFGMCHDAWEVVCPQAILLLSRSLGTHSLLLHTWASSSAATMTIFYQISLFFFLQEKHDSEKEICTV